MTAPNRRQVLGAAGALAGSCMSPTTRTASARTAGPAGGPVLVGSANALAGMNQVWDSFVAGSAPLDAVIETVKVTEADPEDTSVGLGGLPNEDGGVALDAACMNGPTHNSGAVAAIENILHPSEVARLVMERTDHCLLVGRGAYEFARQYGHPHTELLTDRARKVWLRWMETKSDRDDRLSPADEEQRTGRRSPVPGERSFAEQFAGLDPASPDFVRHGTIHCSGLSASGDIACTTTTSGLAFKIPGRVGDSPIIGAGLYCDQEAGSAGSTGRGEAAILANGSFAIVELMRQGADPVDAGLEVLRRIVRQTQRMAKWQPGLLREDGQPEFNISFYVLNVDGRYAGVRLRGESRYAVADLEKGPRHEPTVSLLP